MNHSRRLFSTLILGATLVHCSAGSDASSGGGGDTPGGAPANGGGGASSGGAPSDGGEGGNGGEPIFTTNGGGGEGGTGGGDIIECVSKTVVGEEVGLAMVILQDRSGSM